MRFSKDLPLIPQNILEMLRRWREVLLAGKDVRLIEANHTAEPSDYFLRVNTSLIDITITLPPAELAFGKEYVVKNIGAATNDVTVDAYSTEEIDGSTTLVLNDGESAVIISNGASWDVIATNT